MPSTSTSLGGGGSSGSKVVIGPVTRQSRIEASALRCAATASVKASWLFMPIRVLPSPFMMGASMREVVLKSCVPSNCSMVSPSRSTREDALDDTPSKSPSGIAGCMACFSTRSLTRPGTQEPVTTHLTGLLLNSATLTSSTISSVVRPSGSKEMAMEVWPWAGTTPARGSTLKAGLGCTTLIAYSNSMGTLHSIFTRLVAQSPNGTLLKSIRLGNLVSFMMGYPCSGTRRLPPSECIRTLSW
mmetsp:Transcript_11628/g.31703  ORF Transcript_11628/g.31703 Transcript_11628/m.31703 type:complete len:243 (+) Transcript_11628:465-1193(+)